MCPLSLYKHNTNKSSGPTYLHREGMSLLIFYLFQFHLIRSGTILNIILYIVLYYGELERSSSKVRTLCKFEVPHSNSLQIQNQIQCSVLCPVHCTRNTRNKKRTTYLTLYMSRKTSSRKSPKITNPVYIVHSTCRV